MASLAGKKRSLTTSSCTSRNNDLGLDKYSICLSAINGPSTNCNVFNEVAERIKETQWYVFNIGSSGEDCLSFEFRRLNKLFKMAQRCQKLGLQRLVEGDVAKEDEDDDKEHQQPAPSFWGRRLFPPPEIPPPITTYTSSDDLWISSAVVDSVLYRIGYRHHVYRIGYASRINGYARHIYRLRLLEDGSRSSTWTRGPSMLKSRMDFKMVSFDGKLFVLGGGCHPNGKPDDDVWAEFLDPKGADVWTPLPQPPACLSLNNTDYFVTSTNSPEKMVLVGSSYLRALFAFHLTNQRWEVLFNREPEKLIVLPPLTACYSTTPYDVWSGVIDPVAAGSSLYSVDSCGVVRAYDFARNKLSKGRLEGPPVQLEDLKRASKEKNCTPLPPVLFHLTGHMFCLFWHSTDLFWPLRGWKSYPIFHCLTFLIVTGNGSDNQNTEEGSLRCIFLACSAQCIHSNVELTEAMLVQ